ncbi:MAG: hypothetical protein QM755_12900 [Luteolibacter sp.]
MKPFHSFAMLAVIAAASQAFAVDATTTPVGYETLGIIPGYNFLGLRLQRTPVAAGKISAVTTSSITVGNSLDLGALLDDNTTYILEVSNANGVTQEVLGSAATGSVLTTPNLSTVVAVNDSYIIRAAATLNSVFGPNDEAGLEQSFSGPGGDVIYLPTGGGNFNLYYFDTLNASWSDYNTGSAVNGNAIAVNYADSVLIYSNGAGATALTVSGEVKKGATGYALDPGYNFLGSIYPAGSTLSSALDAAVTAGSLDQSFSGPGGDVVYVPDGAGSFGLYYYDTLNASWSDYNTGSPVTATSISLPSGVLIYNDGASANVVANAPASYSSL